MMLLPFNTAPAAVRRCMQSWSFVVLQALQGNLFLLCQVEGLLQSRANL
jgi:hypothetical protein